MPIEPNHDPADRRLPYYPDPAAELMVFRLRHADGTDVAGESLVVRVRREGVRYPDVTPIAVEVVRADAVMSGQPAPGQRRLGLDVGAGSVAHGHAAWSQTAARVYLTAVRRSTGAEGR